MKLLVSILAAALLFGAEKKEYRTGTVVAVEFTPQAPAGEYPGMKKGVRYEISSGLESIVCYHISSTVFGDYRKQLAQPKDSIEFRVKGRHVFLRAANKEHKLDLYQTNVRPK